MTRSAGFALAWLCSAAACGSVSTKDPDAAVDPTDAPAAIDAPTPIDALLPIDAPPIDGFACTPNAFESCSGDDAIFCNAAGNGTTTMACGAPGCNATAGRCNTCIPNNVACVNPTTLGTCGPDGLPAGTESCALGCEVTGQAHCKYIVPVYLPNVCDTPATSASFTAQTGTIDTSLDTNCNGGIVAQAGGPPICVIRHGTISVPTGVTATFIGGRAVALVADTGLTITGTLDASASGTSNGPGGGTRAVSSGTSTATSGAGGGGGFVAGGNGGSTSSRGGGLAGGPVFDPLTSTVLLGGQRAAIPSLLLGVAGGGGGGAVTLISCKGTVSVGSPAIIDVGGGGGDGGRDLTGGDVLNLRGGGGGGAGGYAVIQGAAVSLQGNFYANGGGGGGGAINDSGGSANPGRDGSRTTTTAAPGGASIGGTSGPGGVGAVGLSAPGPGEGGVSSPGGGGGATGRFQVYTPLGVNPTIAPAGVSPRFEPSRNVQTR